MHIQPISLTGDHVRLEPLSLAHIPNLALVGLEPSIWQFMLYGEINSETRLRQWVQEMLDRQQRGADFPFAVIYRASQRAIGCTRYMNINPPDRSVEIGGTWYGLEYQHTAVNTESKYLLLKHAFEELGCIRVQFKSDLRNTRSQRALERLGAVREGVLRNHMILPNGTIRHSVYYSIIASEWPAVKARLEKRLRQPVQSNRG